MTSDPMITRLRSALATLSVTEQKMFGGTCFMLRGNMLVGTSSRGLLVRVGKENHAKAAARPHTRPMAMGGRIMEGYVFVDETGTQTAQELQDWLAMARAFVETLPPKEDKRAMAQITKKAPAQRRRARR